MNQRNGKIVHALGLLELILLKWPYWTSLVAQWVRIHLPMQGIWVQSLVQEDPTCLKATKPVLRNYWAHPPQLLKLVHPRAHAPQQGKPLQRESHCSAMKTQCSQKKPIFSWTICLENHSLEDLKKIFELLLNLETDFFIMQHHLILNYTGL